ncbi:hypothetical protein CEXT_294411 [Caerostris extrusa]|uniref:Uncharacterized protein n=1 Tax=Caerostris extrusa TaxID=172846 RepID=A0AAV4M333_CAEEX|nr:hypothetical protein CEXT_294411 [Caerostris extrusa]
MPRFIPIKKGKRIPKIAFGFEVLSLLEPIPETRFTEMAEEILLMGFLSILCSEHEKAFDSYAPSSCLAEQKVLQLILHIMIFI